MTDLSRSGRERPWRTHKNNSVLLSESFRRLEKVSKADRVVMCGSSLKFNVCPEGHEMRLSWANFCRVRMCPMCSWRRSLLVAHQIKLVAHEAVQRKKMRWLFLTLTIKNCSGDELQETINHLMDSYQRFTQRKLFKKVVIGWFRAFEVTRNILDNTYHPHFHILLGVPPSYFTHGYTKTEEWVELWKESLRVDYDPIVHITTVKNKRNLEKEMQLLESKGIEMTPDQRLVESDLSGSAVAELAKYSTKSDDFLVYNQYKQKQKGEKVELMPVIAKGIDENRTDEVVAALDGALSRRRLLAYGGLLKEVWNELLRSGKLEDAESDSADLVHVDDDTKCQCSVCGSNMLEELYSWLPDLRHYIKKEQT